ncbi:hypothetical protein Tco_1027724 [Tanacetum coccineum]
MADENVPAPALTRFDDPILPFAAWLDENRFTLEANLLREALEITPIDQAHQFMSPPSGNAIMDFVNELGYTEEIHFVSRMVMNNLINVEYAEIMWEEFVQAMQTFLVDKANLSIAPLKGKKTKPHVIQYCRFTKLIICHLGRTHNIHQRSASPFHLAEEDHRLGNLKFVPEGEDDEVFEMQIPKELIMNNIRNAPYYNTYMEMVAKHDQKIAAEEGGKKKSATKADKSKKPATTKQLKPKSVKEKSSKPAPAPKPTPAKHPKMGKSEEYDVEQAIQMSLESFQAQGQAHVGGVAIREPVAEATRPLLVVLRRSTTYQFILQRQTPVNEEASTRPSTQPQDDASANIGCDTPSPADAETGKDVANVVNLEEKTGEVDEGQVRSDPGKTPESRPPPEHVLMEEDQAGPDPGQSHVALAGPDPEPMHDDFVSTMYLQVHESLKHPEEEHAQVENPLSSTGTLSSMKNLDAYTFGDQFFNDKPTEEESDKANMETEVESMVTFPIHQASSSVPPLSTLVIDITPPKHESPPIQELIFTATTTTTTITLPLPPPPQ